MLATYPWSTMLAVAVGAALGAVLRWAAQRPSLEEVVLEISNEELNSHFQAIMEVQRSVPRLRIERHTNLMQLPQFCAID